MKTDLDLRNDVLKELKWQPGIDEIEIGVIVEDGIVTLTGTVGSYHKKILAEKAARRVAGVRAVVEDILIKENDQIKTDTEIAKMAVSALEWNASVPKEKIMVVVEDGYIHLSGAVPWNYQRRAAKRTVQNLTGVKGVKNNIRIHPMHKPKDIEEQILAALQRSAHFEAKGIRVQVDDGTVQLKGLVNSLKERREIEKVAYRAPGVKKVQNDIVVQFSPNYI